jgi:heme O synthase-like polyprenyltransferase
MKLKDIFQLAIGAGIVVGFFILLYFLIFSPVPEKNSDLLNLVVGALIGSFATVVGYFYGSSSGSSAKDKTISDIALKTPTQTKELNGQVG